VKSRGLEAVFHEATQRHDSLALLYSQWSFDKDLIAKALQNIVSIFPHYSRHDASHSRQIIVNIERMLGERIFKLTATDMWLILESAYSHDIGMVITHKQIEDLDSQAFRDFVEDIAHDPNNDLSGFASKWLAQVLQLPQGQAAHTLLEEYKQLLAEWYRRKHPQAAEAIMCNPYEEIGLTSPRNELLPKRLFRALGAICRSHGQSFDEVMKLPFSEAGMGTEDCHPRYVACLLRMADLLDIDDNRFCPVMMRMSGVELPATSHAHHEKHQAIRHFRLDSERIKIEVACPSPESYEVAHDWFRWLEQEYHSQSQHWPKIVPSKKLGRLPTLAPPKVVLDAPYVTLSEGKRPSFEVDKEAIFALVRGTGLYKSKFDSIREVLQNAVDATLMWIWHEHEEVVKAGNPLGEALLRIYDQHRISVEYDDVPDTNKIRLRIKDVGIGISRSDLSRMMVVGGSAKNFEKARIVRRMPAWFRPSGNFGIGLQSIYLLADRFTVTTRSRVTHESFRLVFDRKGRSPLIITQIASDDASYGALVEVDIEVDEFPIPSVGGLYTWDEVLREKLKAYDFTRERSNLSDFEKFKIADAIELFDRGSPVKLVINGGLCARVDAGQFYCNETNVVLRGVSFGQSFFPTLKYHFKGQPLDADNLNLGWVEGSLDFYGQQAMGFISYNRASIVPESTSAAKRMGTRAIINYIKTNYDALGEQKPYAAAVMLLQGERLFDVRFETDVLKVKLDISDTESITIGEFLAAVKSKRVGLTIHDGTWTRTSAVSSDKYFIRGEKNVFKLLRLVATLHGLYWCDHSGYLHSLSNDWSEEDVFPVSSEILRQLLAEFNSAQVGRRLLFPCWGDFRKLAVKERRPWARIIEHISYQDDYLVFPYVFDWDKLPEPSTDEELFIWVYQHRKDERVTLEEIRQLYGVLLDDIKSRVAVAEES